MGFRSFRAFNISLMAKQGWHLRMRPDSLLVQVLKSKYYPQFDFLQFNL